MTDSAAAATKAPEAHNTPAEKPHDTGNGGVGSWASDFASSVWGAAKVVGHVSYGAAAEVASHPLKTAAEVAGGVAVAAVAAEVGVTATAAAAVGAVALTGYGLYRGAQIAATEGVGAIPAHMRAEYEDIKHKAGTVIDAAASVYHGEEGKKGENAAATLEKLGSDVAPMAAAAVGGAGGELGQTIMRGGAKILGEVLPPLSIFEPAYAYAGGVMGGAQTAAMFTAKVGAEAAVVGGVTAGSTYMAREAQGDGMSDYDRQQHFIEGRKGPALVDAKEGMAAEIGNGFRSIDSVMKNGGQRGMYRFTDDGNGWFTAEVTEGPYAGRQAIWRKGDTQYLLEGTDTYSGKFTLPN